MNPTLGLRWQRSLGLSLIELMIALSLGLFVVLAATALLVSYKKSYLAVDDALRLEENGRFVIELIARTARQAAYVPWENWLPSKEQIARLSPALSGQDDKQFATGEGAEDASAPGVNGSDMLILRHFGSGRPADNTIVTCAGSGVAEPANIVTAEQDRGWSIFYVARDKSNIPELRCRHKTEGSWATDSIVRGVDTFQVLYGLDTNGDGMPNQLMRASEIAAPDWDKVVSLRIALLMRGESRERIDQTAHTYDLFGRDYSRLYSRLDQGVQFVEDRPNSDFYTRKLFQTTIELRNHYHQ